MTLGQIIYDLTSRGYEVKFSQEINAMRLIVVKDKKEQSWKIGTPKDRLNVPYDHMVSRCLIDMHKALQKE